MAQLAKVKAVRFDVRQFHWLGSTGPDGTMFAIRSSLPYKSFKDLQTLKDEIVVGTTGPGSNSHDGPLLLKEFAGAKFKLLAGFAGQRRHPARARARRSGRLVGALHLDRPGGGRRASCARWCAAAAPVKGFEHLPVDEDLMPPGIGRSLMVIRGTPPALGRPYGVRPGTPADRVALLRDAFAEGLARSAVPGRDGEGADRRRADLGG